MIGKNIDLLRKIRKRKKMLEIDWIKFLFAVCFRNFWNFGGILKIEIVLVSRQANYALSNESLSCWSNDEFTFFMKSTLSRKWRRLIFVHRLNIVLINRLYFNTHFMEVLITSISNFRTSFSLLNCVFISDSSFSNSSFSNDEMPVWKHFKAVSSLRYLLLKS